MWCVCCSALDRRNERLTFLFALRCAEVKEVTLGSAPAAAVEEESWIPICKPEDLPKGARARRSAALVAHAARGRLRHAQRRQSHILREFMACVGSAVPRARREAASRTVRRWWSASRAPHNARGRR